MRRMFDMIRVNRLEEIAKTVNPNQVSEIIVTESRASATSELPDSVTVKIGYVEYYFYIADINERIHRDNYTKISMALQKADPSIKITYKG